MHVAEADTSRACRLRDEARLQESSPTNLYAGTRSRVRSMSSAPSFAASSGVFPRPRATM